VGGATSGGLAGALATGAAAGAEAGLPLDHRDSGRREFIGGGDRGRPERVRVRTSPAWC
jgi:hypothetical protein